MKFDAKTIMISGLGATAAMTMLMLAAPLMGMPKMPIGEMLASFMGIPVFLGWTVHAMIGVILAAIYVVVFKDRLPGSAAVRGIIFAMIPFLMAQLIVMPMMGAGLFSANTPAPFLMVLGSLMGHAVYGAVLGLLVAKVQIQPQNAAVQ